MNAEKLKTFLWLGVRGLCYVFYFILAATIIHSVRYTMQHSLGCSEMQAMSIAVIAMIACQLLMTLCFANFRQN